MCKIYMVIFCLLFFCNVNGQSSGYLNYQAEKEKVLKQIRRCLEYNLDILSKSCKNEVYLLQFNSKAKFQVIGVNGDMSRDLYMCKFDTIKINWALIDDLSDSISIIQPFIFECEGQGDRVYEGSSTYLLDYFKNFPFSNSGKTILFRPIYYYISKEHH